MAEFCLTIEFPLILDH